MTRERRANYGARAAMLAVAMTFAIAVLGCASQEGTAIASRKKTLADSADQIAFNGRWLITDRGMQRGQITSDTAFFFDDNTRIEMRGTVRGLFYGSTGALDAVLTARAATYNMRTQSLEARGDVVMNSVDGRRLTTPLLKYDQRTNQISSDSAFTATEPGREMKGVGFRSDPDMLNVNVTKMKRTKAGAVDLPSK